MGEPLTRFELYLKQFVQLHKCNCDNLLTCYAIFIRFIYNENSQPKSLFAFQYKDQTWFFMHYIRQAGGRSFQHLPRDHANVNALKNHVRSLLLHKS